MTKKVYTFDLLQSIINELCIQDDRSGRVFDPPVAFRRLSEGGSGDNLTNIAKKFNTTVAAIASQNNISDADKINAGDELVIPGNN